MARYNSGKNYNSSTNYGAGAATEGGAVQWQVLVDWDNNGTLDSTNEAVRLVDCTIERGRAAYLAPIGGGFEHVRPGRATLTLDNYDRRYDPRYSSSPLYPNVKPGRKIYIAVVDLSTATTYVLFVGKIDDIVPLTEPGGGTVQIECVDYMAALNDQALSFTASGQNQTITSALTTLLTDAGYPGTINLDNDTQPVIVFGVTDQNAGQVAHQLADAGMGTFFVDKNGAARFFGRNHTYPAATAIAQTQIKNDPVITQPWNEVYNHVTAITARPIKQQPSVIYFLPGPVQLTAATPVTLEVDYKSSFDVAISGYGVYANKDRTGTDLTSSTTVTSVLGYNGGTVTVTCSSNAWLTDLNIRGRAWGVVEEKKTSQDATSQGVYGLRRFILQSPFLQDPNYATNHAGVIKTFAKDDREAVTIQIEAREDLQFPIDLMTPIALTITSWDINSTYYVMGIKHAWRYGAQGVLTTLNLSKIIADSTSVTAAEILSEPAQAPLGYQNPAGDPDTINYYYINPPPGGGPGGGTGGTEYPLSPAYLQISVDLTSEGTVLSGGYISWPGNAAVTLPLAAGRTPYYQFPSGMFNTTTGSDKIYFVTPGTYFCELWVTNDPVADDYFNSACEIVFYGGSTYSSGINDTDVTIASGLTVSRVASTANLMVQATAGQYIRCRIDAFSGASQSYASFKMFRIGPTLL